MKKLKFFNAPTSESFKSRFFYSIVVLIVLILTSCGLPVADETDGATDGVTGSGTTSEFWVGVKIPSSLDNATNKPRYKVHQTEFPNDSSDPDLPDFIADKCVADPDDDDDKDIFCVLHGDETDLAFHGAELVVNAHADKCQYLTVNPSLYWDAPPGAGPIAYKSVLVDGALVTAASSITTSNAVLHSAVTSYGTHVINTDGTLTCGFDYSGSEGGNCCYGEYNYERHSIKTSQLGTTEYLSATDGTAEFELASASTQILTDRYVYVVSVPASLSVAGGLAAGSSYLYDKSSKSLTPIAGGAALNTIAVTTQAADVTDASQVFTSAGHGYVVGEILQIPAAGVGADVASGVTVGGNYTVNSVPDANTFTLLDDDNEDVTITLIGAPAGGAASQVQFFSNQIEIAVFDFAQNDDPVEWGGEIANCIGSGVMDTWGEKDEGIPAETIVHIPSDNVTMSANATRAFDDVSVLNYPVTNFFGDMDVDTQSTWPTAFRSPATITYSGGALGSTYGAAASTSITQPFYTATCLDQDGEISARIRFAILDWNTKDEFADYIDDEDHASGDPDYKSDWNGAGSTEDTPFGTSYYNDYFDFDDLENWSFEEWGIDMDNDGDNEPYPNLKPLVSEQSASLSMSARSGFHATGEKKNPFFDGNDFFMGDVFDAKALKKVDKIFYNQMRDRSRRARADHRAAHFTKRRRR